MSNQLFSDLRNRMINKSLTSVVLEQPLIRVLLAQQTRTVPGNAFSVASSLANQNVLNYWKGLDAFLMLQLAIGFVESLEVQLEHQHGWQSLVLPLLELPFETVQTRLSTDPLMKEENFNTALWEIFDHEGICGLMKGSLVRIIDLASTKFLIETIRPSIESTLGQSSALIEPSCHAISTILLYPLKTLVKRLQSQTALDEKKSTLQMLSFILKKEGLSSLYSGFPLYILLIFLHHHFNPGQLLK